MVGGVARLWIAALGVALGSAVGLELRPGWAAAVLGVASLAALLRRRSRAAGPCLAAAAFAIAWFGAAMRAPLASPIEALAAGVPRCEIEGDVLERAGGLGTLVAVEVARCEGHLPVARAGVVALDGETMDAGSAVWAEGWLLPLSKDGFGQARRRLGAGAELDAGEVSTRPPRAGLLAIASSLRSGLARAGRRLEPGRAALLRGLAIGDTSALEAALVADFRRAGLSHLLAVSGSNVAIVLGAVALALGRLRLEVRIAGALAALVLFVAVVGPEPSVLRAAAMGTLGLVALVAGRRAEPLHGLAIALIAVVGLRPGLVASVGLHLSAAATAGIVLWARPLATRLALVPRPVALGLGATLAAQLAVAPLVVATFGELSVAGPVANLLAMPAVPPATIAGLAAALAGALYEPAGGLVAKVGEPFVAWILWVGTHLGRAPWASVELPAWSGWLAGAPLLAGALRSAARRGAPRSGLWGPVA